VTRVRIIGPGRAGTSLALALERAGWDVLPTLGRGDELRPAASGTELLVIATPDAVVAAASAAVEPREATAVAHLSGVLGLDPLRAHPRRAVLHPLVALPDPDRGSERLVGAWFGLAAEGDPLAAEAASSLRGKVVHVAEADWPRYHAAASIASNHLVALLGQVERVASGVGVPVEAFLDLARGSLADVADLGPADALTGPVRRGDAETVARHLAALPVAERAAYEALAREAARLCP
jgi:predicted short-subunit dehydrogenase-like oxidoreductase (DUF2520 family)